MNHILRSLLIVTLCTLSVAANATVYNTNPSTVTYVDTYTQFGSGDVVFGLASNSLASSCPYGFWIKGTDSKTAIGELLAAFHAGKSIMVFADTSIIWSGNVGNPACQVWSIRTLN